MNKILLAFLVLLPTIIVALAPLHDLDQPTVIPDQYIVVLHQNTTLELRDHHLNELVSSFGTRGRGEKILARFQIGDWIAYSAVIYKDLLAEVLDHSLVRYVSADQIVTINDNAPESDTYDYDAINSITQQGATWGIDRIDQRDLPLDGLYRYETLAGAGVNAYIVDTGILTTHNDFGGRAHFGVNTVGDGNNADCNGHGTHVAGTVGGEVYGVAKKTTLIAVKVLNCAGSGSWTGVAQGIEYTANDRNHTPEKKVGNMSLGGGANTAVDDATRAAIGLGVNYAIAAGNSNANTCNYSPARVAEAVTAGATARADSRSTFSNYGAECTDIFAPGTDITSAWIGSNTATSTISGTSMASPHVAGALAVRLGYASPIPSPAALQTWIKAQGTPNKITGTNALPNLLLFSPYTGEQI